jgi:hypothetical protein
MTRPGRRDLGRALLALPILAVAGCGGGSSSSGSSSTPAAQPSIEYPTDSPVVRLDGTSFVVDRERREVVAGRPEGLVVWEVGTPQPVRDMPADGGGVLGRDAEHPVLVLTDDSTTIVSPEDGAEIARHDVATPSGEGSDPVKGAVDESATTAVVAGGRDHELRVWDLPAGTSRVVAQDLPLVVGVALVDTDTALLLTHEAEQPGRLRRVSLSDGAESEERETADPRALAYHHGRALVAVAGVDSPGSRSIRIYEGVGGDEVGHVSALPEGARWMAFSPDGSRLAVSDVKNLGVVDVATMNMTRLAGSAGDPLGVAWLDDETLVVGGREVFEVWDVTAGKVVDRLEPPEGA